MAATDEIQGLIDEIKKTEPKLDILVANAGASWGGPFEPTPDWSSQKVLDLNVRGVFNLVRLYGNPFLLCHLKVANSIIICLGPHHC